MLAESVTLIDFLNANWASIAAILGAMGLALSGAIGFLARVVWKRIEEYWERRDKRDQLHSEKSDKLVETLTIHAPEQTGLLKEIATTQSALAADMVESHRRDSDVVREIHRTQDAAGEISYALEELANASPTMKPHVERYTRRAREKLGIEAKKPREEP